VFDREIVCFLKSAFKKATGLINNRQYDIVELAKKPLNTYFFGNSFFFSTPTYETWLESAAFLYRFLA